MYQPFDLTTNLLVVHRTMVEEELQRHHPERELRYREASRRDPLVAVRRVAARGLIALGMRLDPSAGEPSATTPYLGACA